MFCSSKKGVAYLRVVVTHTQNKGGGMLLSGWKLLLGVGVIQYIKANSASALHVQIGLPI